MIQLQSLPGLFFRAGCPCLICLFCRQLLFFNGQCILIRFPLSLPKISLSQQAAQSGLMNAVQNGLHQLLRSFIGHGCAFESRIFFRQPAHDWYQFFHFIVHTQLPPLISRPLPSSKQFPQRFHIQVIIPSFHFIEPGCFPASRGIPVPSVSCPYGL